MAEDKLANQLDVLTKANLELQAEITQRERIESELEARVRQQAAVVQVGQCALGLHDLFTLMDEACVIVAETLDVEYCKLLELLPEGNSLLLRAGFGWKEGLVGREKISAGTHSQAGYSLISNQPVIVEDLRTETRFTGPSLLLEHGIVSGMSVIIPGRDRPFGVLGAHTSKRRAFNKDDIHFLESVANVLSEAIERKKSETALRESEEQLRLALQFNQAVIANMGEGLYVVDAQGLVTYVNPAAERLFGWSSAELIGRKMHDMTHYKHPDGTPFPADQCAGLQVLQGGKVLVNYQDAFIRKDGTFFDVVYSSSPIRREGRIAGLTVVFRDVTELKQAESEIRRGAARLQSLIETTQDAVISIDRQGRVVLFNPAAERIFGYKKAEIKGQKVNVLMAEPYATEHDQYVARYEAGGEPRAIGRIRTVEARRKNGEIFPIELSVTQVRSSETDEVRYAAFMRDISELRRGQRWLQSLIDTTQDAVLSIDRQGQIVLFNPAAEQIFGYRREEIVGQKVNVLMGEPYQSEHDSYIEHYERTGEPHAIGRIRTVTAKRKSGELFPIELSVTKVAENADIQYAAFIRDISAKVNLQEQLLERERLATIGSTAAKIGHELANPLNGMFLTIQLLEQRLNRQPNPVDRKANATIRRLKDEISRLAQLTGQFRTISRREKYDFQPTKVGSLIDDVIRIQRPYLKQLNIQIEDFIPTDLPNVSVDRDKIKQALLNLIKNAVEAMPGGGTLSIEAMATEEHVFIDIADTGTGIPLDIDAFEPFLTTKKGGTGIGLVVVRQVLIAHGGNISYRSRPGEGTTFRIELPRK